MLCFVVLLCRDICRFDPFLKRNRKQNVRKIYRLEKESQDRYSPDELRLLYPVTLSMRLYKAVQFVNQQNKPKTCRLQRRYLHRDDLFLSFLCSSAHGPEMARLDIQNKVRNIDRGIAIPFLCAILHVKVAPTLHHLWIESYDYIEYIQGNVADPRF